MPRLPPRGWQVEALDKWRGSGNRGIVSVVTGGGKTVFSLSCVAAIKPLTTLIVVPTTALLDQWWVEIADYFDLGLDEIHVITGAKSLRAGTVNLAVINTAAKIAQSQEDLERFKCFLVVDECHKAASDHFRQVLALPTVASLGLSATPERPYDEGLRDVLIPALGEVIFTYDYRDALRDRVIVPFKLRNIVFALEEDRQKEYDKLTARIARSIQQHGMEGEETVALFLKRARVLNMSANRVRLALSLINRHRSQKVIVFHEDVEACEAINEVLGEYSIASGVYHSRMPLKARAEVLSAYRSGKINVLVTCRALDEGFNVPQTEVGIIAASTATRRQRIQRLGRVVRPSPGKTSAEIYTLVATAPEVDRLKQEETDLEGVASVEWSKA